VSDATAGDLTKTPKYWTIAEVTLIRAAGLLHLATAAVGLVRPAMMVSAFGIVFGEPPTFARALFAVYAALGVGLLRAVGLDRPSGRLFVETTALAKLALFATILVEAAAHRQPATAAIAFGPELLFGVALFRASRVTTSR
jgi:hypothetical protein